MYNHLLIKSANFRWDEIENSSYLNNIPSVRGTDYIDFQKNVTFFVGENGSGKSTALEAIADAYGFNPEGGTTNFRFSTYEDLSELGSHTRLSRSGIAHFGYFFRAESFFNLSTQAEEYGLKYNGKNLHEQSHGESFWSFFNKYNGAGLYLMDEPEAALSPQRQLSLLIHIKQLVDVGSQFIIITHSPILLGLPDADIISFDDGHIHRISYKETESYQVTEMFINNRDYFLNRLLSDQGMNILNLLHGHFYINLAYERQYLSLKKKFNYKPYKKQLELALSLLKKAGYDISTLTNLSLADVINIQNCLGEPPIIKQD